MKRTFNYTGRHRIERAHVQIRLVESSHQGATIEVNVDLSHYDFPFTAQVFIEARGESSFERRQLENPFDRFFHEQLTLEEIGASEKTTFYLRVVEPGSNGRLLGLAEDIRFVNPADVISEQDALLRVEWGETGQEVWRLEHDPSTGPTLKISRQLQQNLAQFASDPMFVGCVVPQAFRRVLEYALLSEDDPDVYDEAFWFHEWHRWMMALPSLRPLAARLSDEIQSDNVQRWIDETVDEFSKMRTNRFATSVSSLLDSRG